MKKISRIFVLVPLLGAVILGANSCNDSDSKDPKPLSVVPLTLNFESAGGTLTADVTSGLAWTAEPNDEWISVTYDQTTVTVTVGENTGEARTGSVTVMTDKESANINISQAKYVDTGETLSVSPQSLSFESSGGTQSVNVTSNVSWTPTSNDSWITVTTNGSTVDVTVGKNTGEARTGSVTIATSTKSETVTVTQGADIGETFSVNPTLLTFNWHGDEKTVTVTGSDIVITPNESWITVTENSGSFTVQVSDNAGNRTGSVTVTSGTDSETVIVNQRLAADDLVGTWASTEYWIEGTNVFNNNHDIYITKVDDTTVNINNLIWLTGGTTISASDNAIVTVDPDNQAISIAFQKIIPTISNDGWDSYWAHLISSPFANCWGIGFNRVLEGYTVDIASDDFSVGTIGGNPAYGSFIALTQDPDDSKVYYFGFYCADTKWTKISDDPQPAKASFSAATRTQRPISADIIDMPAPVKIK